MGIDGKIYPAHAMPATKSDQLGFMDVWYPIQVKQKDTREDRILTHLKRP